MSEQTWSRKASQITEEHWNRFLSWLHPEPDKAGEKYKDIQRRLIKIFICRGCDRPEDLADETINRVILKAGEISDDYVGDPALYFFGVARYVHHEYLREKPKPQPLPPAKEPSGSEEEYKCLEQCIESLPQRSKELFLQYYREEAKTKKENRKGLAEKLGIPLNALRIRAFRIRMNLQACVVECLEQLAPQ
jgi:DNA-directed RNA polymerase specialized sigma24 family protein